jgi:hypothetical protein
MSRTHAGHVAEELLFGTRCQQRYPMILTAGCGHCTCKFPNADEDGEVTEPDECESVYKSSRTATIMISRDVILRVSYRLTFRIQSKRCCTMLERVKMSKGGASSVHKQGLPSTHQPA